MDKLPMRTPGKTQVNFATLAALLPNAVTETTQGTEITVLSQGTDDDYISLTDIARYKNQQEPKDVVSNWFRLRNTIEYLGIWERIHNQAFKGVEFDAFWTAAWSNAFTLSPQRWIDATNAVGVTSCSGRGGGTYAHKDIAFKFASWISAEKVLESGEKPLDDWQISLTGLNLNSVWENIIAQIGGLTIAEGSTLDERIAADGERAKMIRRIEHIEKQARTEKQPRRKWELAEEAKKLKEVLEDIVL